MNNETIPWRLLANKQNLDDEIRNRDEMLMNNIIRENYRKELTNQIQQRKEKDKMSKMEEKKKDRSVIDRNMENQKKSIQLQKLKSQAYNERELRLDLENQYQQQIKREKDHIIKDFIKQQQKQVQYKIEANLKRQKEQAERKKLQLRKDLKDTIQYKRQFDKYEKQKERELERAKMVQLEMLNDREQYFRDQYIRKLKQKAKTIDYGSHRVFQENVNKSLIERKKEEWRTDQQLLNYNIQFQNQEEWENKRKSALKHIYKDQLQRQMWERQAQKKSQEKRQLQSQKNSMKRYENFNQSIEFQKKSEHQRNKKELLSYLSGQIDQKRSLKRDHLAMKEKEYNVNLHMLQTSNGIVPGNTYHLDPNRRKQLELVANAMAYSPEIKEPQYIPQKYLAERGKKLI